MLHDASTQRYPAALLPLAPARLSPLIEELVSALSQRGTHVYLISGGFRQMIEVRAIC